MKILYWITLTLPLPQQAVKNTITGKFNKNKLSKTRILTTVTHFETVSPITSVDTNDQTSCLKRSQ